MRTPCLLPSPKIASALWSFGFVALLVTACASSGPDIGGGAGGTGGGGGENVSTVPPDCSLQGDLILELGEGDTDFIPLSEGAGPQLHYGPQGGTHLLLAVRVNTPNPLDKYLVTVLAELGNADCAAQPCDVYTKAGSIETVVAGSERITITGENTSDVLGVFVVVDGWLAGTQKRLSVTVEDDCDRKGTLVYAYADGI